MSLKHIAAGKSIPNDFNVIIEIPANGIPVKYEVDKDTGLLMVDRFMPTAMHYPCNYGFVPSTLSEDGDPVDVLVMTPLPVQPGSLIRCRALGVLKMEDEAGLDAKVLAVPVAKICVQYSHIQSLDDVTEIFKNSVQHFFEHYKELEPNKWVKVKGWEGREEAAEEIQQSIARYQASAAVPSNLG